MKSILALHSPVPPALSVAIRKAAIFQVCVTTGFEAVFVLGVLSAQKLNGTNLIFGLSPTTLFALGQLIMALPAGRLMDRIGRKPVLIRGAIGEACGLALVGLSLLAKIPIGVGIGLLMLGLGSGAAQLVYLVGSDLYPPRRRAEGLSFMTTFSAIGVVGGPYLVGLVGDAANRVGLDATITPWFFGAGLVALAAVLMVGVHPEPLEVAHEPARFYPNEGPAMTSSEKEGMDHIRSLPVLLGLYPILGSMGILICFQGLRMSITPLITYILNNRGFSITLGATMVAAVGIGMALASYPVGKLGDRWGRKMLLLCAAATSLACGLIIPQTYTPWLLFATLVILGAAFVTMLNMTRSILADMTTPRERGTVMSASMVANGLAVIVFPTVASYVLAEWGWATISWLGAGLIGLAFVQILFLRETKGSVELSRG